MNTQRLLTGLIATIFLIVGAVLYFSGADNVLAAAGILVRVGFMLGAIWLAWPEFDWLRKRASTLVIVAVVALLIIIAVRRQLFPVAASALVGGLMINGILRRLSGTR